MCLSAEAQTNCCVWTATTSLTEGHKEQQVPACHQAQAFFVTAVHLSAQVCSRLHVALTVERGFVINHEPILSQTLLNTPAHLSIRVDDKVDKQYSDGVYAQSVSRTLFDMLQTAKKSRRALPYRQAQCSSSPPWCSCPGPDQHQAAPGCTPPSIGHSQSAPHAWRAPQTHALLASPCTGQAQHSPSQHLRIFGKSLA